jgi:hypothetical protein
MKERIVSSSVRPSRLLPDAFSSLTISQPAALSLAAWVAVSCPVVETLAYPILLIASLHLFTMGLDL